MAEWLARRTPNHKIVGSSPPKSQSAHQNRPVWATSSDNGASESQNFTAFSHCWPLIPSNPILVTRFVGWVTPRNSWISSGKVVYWNVPSSAVLCDPPLHCSPKQFPSIIRFDYRQHVTGFWHRLNQSHTSHQCDVPYWWVWTVLTQSRTSHGCDVPYWLCEYMKKNWCASSMVVGFGEGKRWPCQHIYKSASRKAQRL